MTVYRIAKERYIHELSGEGARRFGGRWNRKGMSVLYTAENRSLATVEYLVHVPMALLPTDTCIAEITVPDGAKSERLEPGSLPDGWGGYPASNTLAEVGEEWIARGESLVLKVPSSVVRGEWNILINPNHTQFADVILTGVEQYRFDERSRL